MMLKCLVICWLGAMGITMPQSIIIQGASSGIFTWQASPAYSNDGLFRRPRLGNPRGKPFEEESWATFPIYHSLPSAKLFTFHSHTKRACPISGSSTCHPIIASGSPDRHQVQIWIRFLGCGSLNVVPLHLEPLN